MRTTPTLNVVLADWEDQGQTALNISFDMLVRVGRRVVDGTVDARRPHWLPPVGP